VYINCARGGLLSRTLDHFVLDATACVLAAGSGESARAGFAPGRWIGRPLLDVLSEYDGLQSPSGVSNAIATALDEVRATGMPQTTPILAWPHAREGRGQVRGVVIPVFDAARALHTLVVRFEELSTTSAEDSSAIRDDLESRVQQRTAELERANEELLRVIAEQLKTEKALQRSQEQLHHAQRLEAIGRLAGGIAHDFNNLLSVVLGYSISIASELPENSSVRADVEEIRRAGERAAELTHQLLAFGRQQVLEPKVLDLNDVMLHVDRMIRRILGEDIELVTIPATPLWKIKVDPGQIEQVILNLVINARDAMPEGGRLTIETGNAIFDEDYSQVNLGAAPGAHVVLSVTDTGTGMDRDTQAKIFEPFFTTKEKGKGTGLGLSTVFGIVKQSGGHIWVYSEPGKGTTFKVCFPRTAEPGDSIIPAEDIPMPTPRGTETILLVEDDAQLRALARTILVRQGYQVLDAPTPTEALALCAGFARDIALLVTDVVMPQMNGRELARKVVEMRPGIKVLYMSGYTDNAIVHNGILDAGVAFLQKPITPVVFARKVRHVLDGIH
jgi:signal transduction histidine kinase